MQIDIWDGAARVPARVRGVWTGVREVPVTSVDLMPYGYRSVQAMLGQEIFYIGHRGGSLAHPEMSLQAYTAALWRGYGALELSLACTSDGVWFGAHDEYLDRVVLGTQTKTLLPSAMTWDQVRALTILPPTGRAVAAQPFMRLDEYLSVYAPHVVTFIDVKYVPWQRWASLLDQLDAAGGPSKFVAKFFGPGAKAHGWLPLARDRKYLAWGYGYEADAQTIDTWVDDVDLLGMDYGASPAAWAALLATGKRVIGHIVPTPAAAQQAIARGATGLMVSGTHLITPG